MAPRKSQIPPASAAHVASVSALSPHAIDEGVHGPLWVHEIKHDGFRIVARRIGSVVRLQTKQGYDYAERYPLIVEAIARLKVSSVVLDGEAMCFSGTAHDFDKLWNRTHDHEAKLCAFDLLELDGEDYRANRWPNERTSSPNFCVAHGRGSNMSNTWPVKDSHRGAIFRLLKLTPTPSAKLRRTLTLRINPLL